MIEESEVERLRRHLVAITGKADDADALAKIVALQDEFAEIIRKQARKLNAQGYSWQELSEPLALSRQATHTRYASTPSATSRRKGARVTPAGRPGGGRRPRNWVADAYPPGKYPGIESGACPSASAPSAAKSSPE